MKVVRLIVGATALGLRVACAGTVRQASDYAEFKALESVLQEGDTVELTGERYAFTAPISINSANVTIRGTGAKRPVLDGQGASRGLLIDSVLTPTLENLVFTNFVATGASENGAAVSYPVNSKLTVRNCDFIDNHTMGFGAAADVGYCWFENCRFENNSCDRTTSLEGAGGGAIYFSSAQSSTSTFTNCVFAGNELRNNMVNGGGGAINSTAALKLYDCVFTNNACANIGGCIFGDVRYATNCLFVCNRAARGGTLGNCNKKYEANAIVDCRFVKNAATTGGGAVFNHNQNKGRMNFTACRFEDNEARVEGGAIHANSYYVGNIVGCRFAGNRAHNDLQDANASSGGAIYGGAVLLADCLFTNNVAKWSGAAIHGFSFPTAADGGGLVTNCTFVGNRCSGSFDTTLNGATGGGSAYVSSGLAIFDDCRFVGNRAGDCLRVRGNWLVCGVGLGLNAANGRAQNCRFEANLATNALESSTTISAKGALYLGTSCVASNCTFVANTNAQDAAFGSALSSNASVGTTNRIVSCTFRRNVSLGTGATGYSGALEFREGGHAIADCLFEDNLNLSAKTAGGAIGCYPHNVKDLTKAVWFGIDRCRFLRNQAALAGGAIAVAAATDWSNTPATPSKTNQTWFVTGFVRNSLFVDNQTTGDGGAFYLSSAHDVVLENCTFANNRAGSNKKGGAVYLGAGYAPRGDIPSVNISAGGVTNCLFYGNTVNGSQNNANAHIFCNSAAEMCGHDFEQAGTKNFLTDGENGNLVRADPKFATGTDEPWSLARSSCCVDAGAVAGWMATARDIRNDKKYPRVIGLCVDVGAYEYRPNLGILLLFR